MVSLLGKRPFLNRADDMDKWLDENGKATEKKKGEVSAPPPIEPGEPIPVAMFRSHENL